jgi:2-keto-3-deoxy-L-rhamnonate aldolase RhmA
MSQNNSLRSRMYAGEKAIGPILVLPSIYVAQEAATQEKVNFIWIDLEHGAINRESAAAMVLASRDRAAPLVRVTSGEYWLIKQVLDMGAAGLVVPMVDTKEQAKEIIQAALYPPKGIRGFGPDVAAPTWGITIPDYIQKANDEILIVLQIESVKGLQNADEIASLERVDVLFAGAYDISICLGKPGMIQDPEVDAAIRSVCEVAHRHGKLAGTIALDPELGQKRLEQGFDFLVTSTDMVMISNALDTYLSSIKIPASTK